MTAAARKSVTDLTRRKTRAAFTVLTLAIAVASVGILAIPSLMEQAMDREIAATKLADLTVTMQPVELDAAALRRVADVDNVAAVQPKSIVSTRVQVDGRRQKALVIGVPDFAAQQVDVITVTAGRAPRDGQLLTDSQNAPKDKFPGTDGGQARLTAAGGQPAALPVVGTGQYLGGSDLVAGEGFAVFYATPATVARLSGTAGTTMLGMRLRDGSQAAAEQTAAGVRRALEDVPGFTAFADYPEIRTAGDYPGRELFEQTVSIMSVITLLAILSALVLLGNTMSTLIGEQTREIAAMKAIGATRRDIRRIYGRTAMLLGVLGAILGVVLGVVLANLVTSFFAQSFYGIDAGVHVDGAVLAASLVVGLAGPPLAALPAARRAARLPVRDALDASGSALGGQGRLDALLRRVRALPRSAQIGLRGVARRKRRAAATVVQVALAVGTLLAVLALGTSVGNLATGAFARMHWDIWATTFASEPLDDATLRSVAAQPGVAEAQPLVTNVTRITGKDVYAYGLPDDPLYEPELERGAWPTAAEVRDRTPVAVVGRAVAERAGADVGDTLVVQTAAGPVRSRLTGIATKVMCQVGPTFGWFFRTPLRLRTTLLEVVSATPRLPRPRRGTRTERSRRRSVSTRTGSAPDSVTPGPGFVLPACAV